MLQRMKEALEIAKHYRARIAPYAGNEAWADMVWSAKSTPSTATGHAQERTNAPLAA